MSSRKAQPRTSRSRPIAPGPASPGPTSPSTGATGALFSAITGLARQIGKRRAFESPEQEAFLNLFRTASFLETDFQHLFRAHGLTSPTYNVLRVLRGCKGDPAAPHGRTCSQVGEHLITHVPDVTRLVDRLEQQGLASRQRCDKDRRVVYVAITPKGETLLAALDGPVLDLHRAQLGHMTSGELSELSRLLVKARSGSTGPGSTGHGSTGHGEIETETSGAGAKPKSGKRPHAPGTSRIDTSL